MKNANAIVVVESPIYADVSPEQEAQELMALSNASKMNREKKLSEAYADMYHREHCARIHEANRHQREMNNYLIFFLVLVASVIEILISVSGPAWVAAIPVIVTALIVRFLK